MRLQRSVIVPAGQSLIEDQKLNVMSQARKKQTTTATRSRRRATHFRVSSACAPRSRISPANTARNSPSALTVSPRSSSMAARLPRDESSPRLLPVALNPAEAAPYSSQAWHTQTGARATSCSRKKDKKERANEQRAEQCYGTAQGFADEQNTGTATSSTVLFTYRLVLPKSGHDVATLVCCFGGL